MCRPGMLWRGFPGQAWSSEDPDLQSPDHALMHKHFVARQSQASCASQTFNRGNDDEFNLGRSSGTCEWSGQ
jgi:hypothetical protein